MSSSISPDIIFGVGVIAAALIVVYLFVRATSPSEEGEEPSKGTTQLTSEADPLSIEIDKTKSRVKVPSLGKTLDEDSVEIARSNIRTLTLKQEILSMVMRRLFDAEDEGEITRDERISLAKNYEQEMKDVQEELKKSELEVSLNELEAIREDIIKKFESTLNNTQRRIDLIIKELKIQEPVSEKEVEKKPKPKRKAPEVEEEPEEEIEEEEEEEPRRHTSDVDERLNKLKQEVLKELEELDRLELEG